jgi:hypothetical protein
MQTVTDTTLAAAVVTAVSCHASTRQYHQLMLLKRQQQGTLLLQDPTQACHVTVLDSAVQALPQALHPAAKYCQYLGGANYMDAHNHTATPSKHNALL